MSPTNEGSPYQINRQIYNEHSKGIVIMGQGQDATVTVGEDDHKGSSQPDSHSIQYPPPGHSIDERIHNRNNETITVIAQGSRAQAHISESFAATLLRQPMPVQEELIERERALYRAQQAWAWEWNWMQHTLARQAWELEQQAREIARLRHIIICISGDGQINCGDQCQDRTDSKPDAKSTTVSQSTPPSKSSNPILSQQVEPGLAVALSPPPEVTDREPGQSGMTSPPFTPLPEQQIPPPPGVRYAAELPRPDTKVTPSNERTSLLAAASASTSNEAVQPSSGTPKSMKTRLASSFSQKSKAFSGGGAA